MAYDAPRRVRAVVLDWAGTVVDFGSIAPARVIVDVFEEAGIVLTLAEARAPTGLGKWQHIRALCDDPAIAARFVARTGRAPGDDDVTALHERFMQLQHLGIAEHSAPIPGAREALAALRGRGIRIGSCSNYPTRVMDRLVAVSQASGLTVDHVVATDEVPNGRPWPAQALANVIALGVEDVAACVKVDDTVPGILEGRRAGMWTVALACSGKAMGLSLRAFQGLPAARLAAERARVGALFAAARPHVLVNTIADLPEAVRRIDHMLAAGQLPQGC